MELHPHPLRHRLPASRPRKPVLGIESRERCGPRPGLHGRFATDRMPSRPQARRSPQCSEAWEEGPDAVAAISAPRLPWAKLKAQRKFSGWPTGLPPAKPPWSPLS